MMNEDRKTLRWALIMVQLTNANRDPKKKREPFTVTDFAPELSHLFEREGRALTEEEGAARLAEMRRAADQIDEE